MRRAVRFRLNGESVECADFLARRTMLDFLRETRRVVKLDKAALNAGIRHHFALFETHLTAQARRYFEKNAYA